MLSSSYCEELHLVGFHQLILSTNLGNITLSPSRRKLGVINQATCWGPSSGRGREKASMTHISWLQSLRLKYLRTAEDKCTLAIFFSEDKIHTLCWAWKEQQGGKNLRTIIKIMKDHYCFSMAKRLLHFIKETKAQRGNKLPKDVVQLC